MSKETLLLPGYYYHIYNRGNNGENLFIEASNYEYFFEYNCGEDRVATRAPGAVRLFCGQKHS